MNNEIEKPKKKSLAVMSGEFIEMMNKISQIDAQIDSDETLTDEQREVLEKKICEVVAGKGDEIKSKVEDIDYFIGILNDARAKLTQRRADIDRVNKTIDNRISRIKKYVLECMKSIGVTELKQDVLKITCQKNGGKVPIIVDDQSLIPYEYKKYDIEIKNIDYGDCCYLCDMLRKNVIPYESHVSNNEDLIRDAIKLGETVPGAHIGEQSEGIRIKVKSI